jgi:hypothetical protein
MGYSLTIAQDTREYIDRLDNLVHPMIHTLFAQNYAGFQDDNAPTHTAGTVQSWLEEHEGELQHFPWTTQSPDLNITVWEPSSAKQWLGKHVSTEMQFLDKQTVARQNLQQYMITVGIHC